MIAPKEKPMDMNASFVPGKRKSALMLIVGLHALALWALCQPVSHRLPLPMPQRPLWLLSFAPASASQAHPPATPVHKPPPLHTPATVPTRPREPAPLPAQVALATPAAAPAATLAPKPAHQPDSLAPALAQQDSASSAAPSAPGTPARPAQPDAADNPPRFDAAYLNNPAPAYPPLLRRAGEQGRVVLRVLVGAGGLAEQVELLRSSGQELFDQAALAAVRKWRFVAATRAGQAVAGWVQVPLEFSLR
jgi:protein TonB